ncbi:MAG: Fic family protein [Clostridia bacterium]
MNQITYEKIVPDYDKAKIENYWNIATGLNKVDNLTPSNYMKNLIQDNIDGKVEIDAVEESLHKYYEKVDVSSKIIRDERECDFVSKRIVDFLHTSSFSFSPVMLKTIHKRLFENLDIIDKKYVGEFRDYNISKKEIILNGNSVIYGDYTNIMELFSYDFDNEKKYKYQYPLNKGDIDNLSSFTSSIWQVHPFVEGNTRTVALFIQMYLNSKGFDVNNELFKDNSLYFRNALVRSNYQNYKANVTPTNEYLIKFFENLLIEKSHILSNEDLDVSSNFKKLQKLNDVER